MEPVKRTLSYVSPEQLRMEVIVDVNTMTMRMLTACAKVRSSDLHEADLFTVRQEYYRGAASRRIGVLRRGAQNNKDANPVRAVKWAPLSVTYTDPASAPYLSPCRSTRWHPVQTEVLLE